MKIVDDASSAFDAQAKTWDTEYRIHRAEIISSEIRKRVPFKTTDAVLEFGCGTALVGFNLLDGIGSLTLVDNSDGMLSVLREKIRAHPHGEKCLPCVDLFAACLQKGSFDHIYGSMSLHHVADLEGTGRRFHELLRSGGHLCIVDLTPVHRNYHKNESDFAGHDGFDPERLSAQFAALGFLERYRAVFFTDTRPVADIDVEYSLFILVMEKVG